MPGTAFSSANWTGYDSQSYTIPNSGSETGFTLLVDISTLSATWKSEIQSDGADIRCTKDDGTTELAYDLIDFAYNAGAPTGWIRVLWSGAASGGTLRIWAGYTGGTATAYDATETYGSDNAYDANWDGYWPGADTNDRTSNGNNLTANNGAESGIATNQKTGDTFRLNDADSEYFNASTGVTNQPFTMMVWCRPDDVTISQGVITLAQASNSDNHRVLALLRGDLAGDPGRIYAQDAGANEGDSTANGFTVNTWGHIAARASAADARTSIVNNDTANEANSTTSLTLSMARVLLGATVQLSGPASYFSGQLTEAQVHSAARSDDWIAAEYEQSNSQSTWWGTFTWTAAGGGVTVPRLWHHYSTMRRAS